MSDQCLHLNAPIINKHSSTDDIVRYFKKSMSKMENETTPNEMKSTMCTNNKVSGID